MPACSLEQRDATARSSSEVVSDLDEEPPKMQARRCKDVCSHIIGDSLEGHLEGFIVPWTVKLEDCGLCVQGVYFGIVRID